MMATPRPASSVDATTLKRIRALPTDQRRAELTKLQADLISKLKALPPPPPPLSPTTYLQHLAELDVTSASSIEAFLRTSLLPPAQPIPLGSHAGAKYFLQPCTDGVPKGSNVVATPVDRARGLSSIVVAFRRIRIASAGAGAGAPAMLNFGIGLGKLQHQLPLTSSNTGGAAPLVDTGFYVLLNVADRSVWIAIDWYPRRSMGDPSPLDSTVDSWGRLPNDSDLQVGCMRISAAEWWTKPSPQITSGDPFGAFPALPWRIETMPAVERDWKAAVGKN